MSELKVMIRPASALQLLARRWPGKFPRVGPPSELSAFSRPRLGLSHQAAREELAGELEDLGREPEMAAEAVLVTQGRDDAVADAMELLLGNPATREAYGAAGRQKIRNDYSVEVAAARLNELFDGIVRADV